MPRKLADFIESVAVGEFHSRSYILDAAKKAGYDTDFDEITRCLVKHRIPYVDLDRNVRVDPDKKNAGLFYNIFSGTRDKPGHMFGASHISGEDER